MYENTSIGILKKIYATLEKNNILCYNIYEMHIHKRLISSVLLVLALPASVAFARTTALTGATAVPTSNKQMRLKVAERLLERVASRYNITSTLAKAEAAVRERQSLLKKSVMVTLEIEGVNKPSQATLWPVTVYGHADWITFNIRSNGDMSFALDERRVQSELSSALPLGLPAVIDGVAMEESVDAYGIKRIRTTTNPAEGFEWDGPQAASSILEALQNDDRLLTVSMVHRDGTLTVTRDGTQQTLTLLSAGLSDYRTSPAGRRANIQKAVEQQLHGVRILPGSTFSFNATLGGPITKSRGWQDSLIIVNGMDLEPAPGGGICQAATTVYRAAILAGLPIVKRAPHSLYVHYYKLFGLGLDATIFPGRQDLVFQNDTPGDIVLQASTEGTGVRVEFYGISDGRTVAMDGPYFNTNASPEAFGRALRSNEIGWLQHITYGDGRKETKTILSAYNKMPRSLATEMPKPHEVIQPMHAAPHIETAMAQ